MAITYSYKIDQLRKVDSLNGLSDVIVHVRFTTLEKMKMVM